MISGHVVAIVFWKLVFFMIVRIKFLALRARGIYIQKYLFFRPTFIAMHILRLLPLYAEVSRSVTVGPTAQ